MIAQTHDFPVDYVERAIDRLELVATLLEGTVRASDDALYNSDLLALLDMVRSIIATMQEGHAAAAERELPPEVRLAVDGLVQEVRRSLRRQPTRKPARVLMFQRGE